MKIGYARVSTKEQNLQLQLDALNAVECEKIFTDKVSSIATKRQGLEDALEFARPGDVLIVWKLDRLCRSITDLIKISKQLEDKEVHLQSITESIDTTTPTGRLYFTILGAMNQLERELNHERILAGLDAARKRGRKGGRPRSLNDSKLALARNLLNNGMSYPEVSEHLGVNLKTLYNYIPASQFSSINENQ